MYKLKMYKMALCITLGLAASGMIKAAAPEVNVTAHFPDQACTVRNDPKWLTGKQVIGQSFIPDGDSISFLYVSIFPAEKRQKRVIRLEENVRNLQLALKEFHDGKPGNTIISLSDLEAGVKIGNLNLYSLNVAVTPGKSYLLEFCLQTPGAGDYYYWYQYRGNHYPKGDFFVNRQKRGGSDLDFVVYRPVEITPNTVIVAHCPPEILEIQFKNKPDQTLTSIFLSGPGGVAQLVTTWNDDQTVFLGPLRLPIHPAKKTEYRVYINTDGGQSQTEVIPFILNEKN